MKIDCYDNDIKSLWFHFEPKPGDDLFPVRIISIGHVFSSDRQYLLNSARMRNMNSFRYHSFQYLVCGSGFFAYETEQAKIEREVPPGHLFVMSHDLDFRFNFTTGERWEWLWIVVEGELADHVVAKTSVSSRVFEIDRDSPAILSLKALLQLVFHNPITVNEMVLHGCEFLLKLEDAISMNRLSPQDALLTKSKQIVMRNIRHINVEKFAQYHGYSAKYFQKRFLEITGMTPGRFIQLQKINHAAMLLRNSSKKLSEIAELAGFSDASHLCRIFRDHFEQSPNQWRADNNSWPSQFLDRD